MSRLVYNVITLLKVVYSVARLVNTLSMLTNYSSQKYLGEVGSFLVNTSTPVSVMSKVCSNWAEGSPSAVVAVQSSGQVTGAPLLPKLIIGSMVKVWPGAMTP
eukprot:scaffold268_cov210-Ochromonas_danica.AAC.6